MRTCSWPGAEAEPVARTTVFSGLATPVLADTLLAIVTDHTELSGLLHVAAEPTRP